MKLNAAFFILSAFFVVILAAFFASSYPDGFEKAAASPGFIGKGVQNHSIMANYTLPFIKEGPTSTALAGLLGVIILLGLFSGVKLLLIILTPRLQRRGLFLWS